MNKPAIRQHLVDTVRDTLILHYLQCFRTNREGIAVMTVDEIAERSGVGKATIQKMIDQHIMAKFATPHTKTVQRPVPSKSGRAYTLNARETAYQISQPALAAWFLERYPDLLPGPHGAGTG